MTEKKKKPTLTQRLIKKATGWYNYFNTGVWESADDSFKTRLIKTLNLSIRSFLDRDLQSKSMALTYSTVLAIVPAFALLVAIGRGFGLQDTITSELYLYFPSQAKAVGTALQFVDRYLSQATQGVFVGIGIIVLLWTLVSLLSSIETSFNNIWDIKRSRGFLQQVTDYIAICLVIPLLMLCSSGVSIFMSAFVQDGIGAEILTPVVNFVLEASPLILVWLAFSLSFCLIPNTKVSFKYAAISGALCAISFQVLQLLFVNGQIYVSKYNAIYGSFAFLPLLLIWLQLSWLILLFGCVLTYSLQNVFAFNFMGDLSRVSHSYMRILVLAVASIVVRRFVKGKKPLSVNQISTTYDLPVRIVNRICEKMVTAGLVYFVVEAKEVIGVAPARDVSTLTVGEVYRLMDGVGDTDFIPRFADIYPDIISTASRLMDESYALADDTLVKDMSVPTPTEIQQILHTCAPTEPASSAKKN